MLVTGYQDLMFYLRMRRIMLDMSQPTLADAAGISHSAVCKYEQGKATPPLPRLIEICDALDCQLALLPQEDQSKEFLDAVSRSLMESVDMSVIAKNRRRKGGACAKDHKDLLTFYKATGYGRGFKHGTSTPMQNHDISKLNGKK